MHLFNSLSLTKLRHEFRLSMRRLLVDLCRELQADYADQACAFGIRTGFFDDLHARLTLESYSNWKVVGWIEMLNDLVYLLDILRQFKGEQDRTEFAEQLLRECQEKFFEHGYLDDLFPTGEPQVRGLEQRLRMLCGRLAQEVTQESLWFDPAWPVTWSQVHKISHWNVFGTLADNYERSEATGTIGAGLTGAWCQAPKEVKRALRWSTDRVVFRVRPNGIVVQVGKVVSPIWSRLRGDDAWQWPHHHPVVAVQRDHDPVTVGPTLVYGKHRQPIRVKPPDRRQVERIARAWRTIKLAWPEGHEVLTLLTSRIVPLQATGVVSFSYRHRPGLSFINCFDRGNMDLVDDLIHENSHHQLNLLLRKFALYRGDHNQQIFYSPWRRTLRPLRGILHATFTFTMGALLFQRLSVWGAGSTGAKRWKKAGLTVRDLQRARFRCLEEVASVRYSLHDLHYADHHLGWLTESGRCLVDQLAEAIAQIERECGRIERQVAASQFSSALQKHLKELQQARQTYGPGRLSRT